MTIAPIATAEDHQRAMGAMLGCVRDFYGTWGIQPDHVLVGHRFWSLLAPMFQPLPPRPATARAPLPGVAVPAVQVFGIPVLPTYLDPDLVWAAADRLVVVGDKIRASKVAGTTRRSGNGRVVPMVSTYSVQASLDRCAWRQLTASTGGVHYIDLPGERETVEGHWSAEYKGLVFDNLPVTTGGAP